MTRIVKLSISLLVLLCLGCSTIHECSKDDALSESEALVLAVSIANEKCSEEYDKAPFDETNYSVSFQDGRWVWGSLDIYGIYGFSAEVSFDAKGKNREVVVYFSSDQRLSPSRER